MLQIFANPLNQDKALACVFFIGLCVIHHASYQWLHSPLLTSTSNTVLY